MKNATTYEKKLRKLLGTLPKSKLPEVSEDPFAFVLEAILQAEAPRKQATAMMAALREEFVDYNELRVAPVKDILECFDEDFPAPREKADSIIRFLNALFDRFGKLSLEHLSKMPKRELRKHLQDLGLNHYSSALVTMVLFGGHAIPVDHAVADCLEIQGCVFPVSDLADVQGFLERVIPQRDAWGAHVFFREHIEENYKALVKWRKDNQRELVAPPPPPAPVEIDYTHPPEQAAPPPGTQAPAAKAASRSPRLRKGSGDQSSPARPSKADGKKTA